MTGTPREDEERTGDAPFYCSAAIGSKVRRAGVQAHSVDSESRLRSLRPPCKCSGCLQCWPARRESVPCPVRCGAARVFVALRIALPYYCREGSGGAARAMPRRREPDPGANENTNRRIIVRRTLARRRVSAPSRWLAPWLNHLPWPVKSKFCTGGPPAARPTPSPS